MVRTIKPWHLSGGQLVDAFRREVDELVGRLQDTDSWADEVTSFTPRTNVAETDTQFEISMEMPAMKADDFNVELHDGSLTVSGQREREETIEGKTFHRVERQYGKFCRTFNLGHDVEPDKVTAEYRDGVLHLTVPKSVKAQPRKIQVS